MLCEQGADPGGMAILHCPISGTHISPRCEQFLSAKVHVWPSALIFIP